MDAARRRADDLDGESFFEAFQPIPEANSAAEHDRRDHEMHVLNEIGREERPHGGRSSTDTNVQVTGRLLRERERLRRCGVDEVEGGAAFHVQARPRVMGQDEDRRVEHGVVAHEPVGLSLPPVSLHHVGLCNASAMSPSRSRIPRVVSRYFLMVVLLSSIGVAQAASATAAVINVTVNCTTGHDTRPVENLTADAGDTLSLSGSGCGFGSSFDSSQIFTTYASQYFAPGPYIFVIADDAAAGLYGTESNPYIFVDNNVASSGTTSNYSGQYYTLTVTLRTSLTAVNPPWLQAVGRTTSTGACPDGWSPSYAQWPNGGAGGWVCEFVQPTYGS